MQVEYTCAAGATCEPVTIVADMPLVNGISDGAKGPVCGVWDHTFHEFTTDGCVTLGMAPYSAGDTIRCMCIVPAESVVYSSTALSGSTTTASPPPPPTPPPPPPAASGRKLQTLYVDSRAAGSGDRLQSGGQLMATSAWGRDTVYGIAGKKIPTQAEVLEQGSYWEASEMLPK